MLGRPSSDGRLLFCLWGDAMERVNKYLNRFLEYVIALLLTIIVTLVLLQVILRFFGSSFTWIEELSRYLFVWSVFLGTALGIQKGAHLSVEMIVVWLSPRSREKWRAVVTIVLMLFFITLGYYAMKVYPLWTRKVSAAMKVPMSSVFLALPVSIAIILLFLASRLISGTDAK